MKTSILTKLYKKGLTIILWAFVLVLLLLSTHL